MNLLNGSHNQHSEPESSSEIKLTKYYCVSHALILGHGDIDEEVVRLEVETPAEMVESSGK